MRGERTDDLMTNLFKAYNLVLDADFFCYININKCVYDGVKYMIPKNIFMSYINK